MSPYRGTANRIAKTTFLRPLGGSLATTCPSATALICLGDRRFTTGLQIFYQRRVVGRVPRSLRDLPGRSDASQTHPPASKLPRQH